MKKDAEEKKKLQDVEKTLRNGKLPDTDLSNLRHNVWQRVLSAQRQRRQTKSLLKLPPWTWALASILVILLGILVIFFLK